MFENTTHRGDELPPLLQRVTSFTRARAGLSALLRARNYARDAGVDAWDFALEIDEIYQLGLTISDIRWMVAKGYAEHGEEISVSGEPHRSFEAGIGLIFEPRTCLVLTESGADYAAAVLSDSEAGNSGDESSPIGVSAARNCNETPSNSVSVTSSAIRASAKPQWNSARRELLFSGLLVKRFRVPARNQEWILEVFEEDGWPEHIDDPLPPSADICPKARLHDAINRLNGKQINSVLRFHGNGNGNGLIWKQVGLEMEV